MGKESARRRNSARRATKKAARALPSGGTRSLSAEDTKHPPAAESETEEHDAPMAPMASADPSVGGDTSETSSVSPETPTPRRPRKIARCDIDGLSQKDASDARGPCGLFPHSDGTRCMSCRGVDTLAMRSKIHGGQYSVCSKIWCASHAAKLIRLPTELAGAPPGSSSDGVSTNEGECERAEETLGRLKKRLIASIGLDGKSKTGVDLGATMLGLRARVAQGLPLFRKGEFRDFIPTPAQWEEVEKDAFLAAEAGVAPCRVPKSCIRSGSSGRVGMRVSFALEPDVQEIESFKNYEL